MEQKAKKPIFKKWWFWLIIAVVVIGIIAASGGSKDKKDGSDDSKAAADATDGNGEPVSDTGADDKSGAEAYEIGEGEVRLWTNSIGTQWLSAAVPVKNTGEADLYLSSGTLDIENAEGKLIKTLEYVSVYPQVLKPGETAYYYEETTLDEATDGAGFKIVPHLNVSKSKVACIRFTVSEVEIKDETYGGAKVIGRVENTSNETQKLVYVAVNLYDKDGKLLAQQMTTISQDLAAGEKIGFEASNLGFDFNAADVARYEIYAYPHQYQF